MKIRNTLITALLALVISGLTLTAFSQPKAVKAKTKGKKIELFNGKDLSNWAFHLRDASVDPATVFTVQNGVVHITGTPFGYMRTEDQYSEYQLHVEYRWPVEPTNSGIFIHTQLPDTIWPMNFECQLSAGNAGDFVCSGGSDMNERTDKKARVVRKKAASTEKPAGEWNIVEILCKANTIEVYVNGVLQNKGTGLSKSSGYICLQSEGKDIEFRNVYLTKLKK
jgi:hypothetical protein